MSTTPELKQHLDRAVDRFHQAWKTGDWQPFSDLVVDHGFVIQLPAGPHAGKWSGPDAHDRLAQVRATFESEARISDPHENLRLYDGNWVIVADESEGMFGGDQYRGVEVVLMRVTDSGQIAEYREYIGAETADA